MIIKEVVCKSALTGSHGNFTLNPYAGCQHGCSYCYATYITRWKNEKNEWGDWVHVKTNIAEVLKKQLLKTRSASIFMSTICDVYQLIEAKYKITQKCLLVLSSIAKLDRNMNITLLTKSDLISRDINILKDFPDNALKIGFSVNTMNDKIASVFEHNASPPSHRLKCAIALKKEGIKTGIYVNPILPYITEKELPAFVKFVNENNLDFIGFDTLNYIVGHVGKKVKSLYNSFGSGAVRRFNYAKEETGYKEEIKYIIKILTADCRAEVDISF